MRRILLVLAVALSALSSLAADVRLSKGACSIVVGERPSGAVRFAADELSQILGKILGGAVPVVAKTADAGVSFVLGDQAETRAAGIDVAALPQEGYRIKVAGRSIFIAGRDHPQKDFARLVADGSVGQLSRDAACGTLHGTYAFLERFCGVRFYFPGDVGTVVPKSESLDVQVCDLTESPNFIVRDAYFAQSAGTWPDPDVRQMTGLAHEWLRLRMQSDAIPCNHGQNFFSLAPRFHKTHPEYFQLRKDGTRCTGLDYSGNRKWTVWHLCHTSKVIEEIYRDVRSYLLGEPPSVRGVTQFFGGRYPENPPFAWNRNCHRRYVDVMPQDGFMRCECENCRAAYTSEPNYATDLVWGYVDKMARRLQAEGIEGDLVMLAYSPYRRVPDFPLATNIQVMVAETGPWADAATDCAVAARDDAEVRAWAQKVGHKVWTWTYPLKGRSTAFPGVPQMAPRTWGCYYKRLSPWTFGSFVEAESDKFIYNYLNYYVFSRVALNNGADVEAILDEHHRLMFGKGAPFMAEFYDGLEKAWRQVVGAVRQGALGPEFDPPDEHRLWTEIYSSRQIAAFEALVDRATEAAAGDAASLKRIAFMRRELLEPLAAKCRDYNASVFVEAEQKRRMGRTVANLVENGACDVRKSWKEEAPSLTMDRLDFVSVPASIRLTATNATKRTAALQYFPAGALKSKTRYRLSFFIKLDGVRKFRRDAGVFAEIFADDYFIFPKEILNGPCGTTGWLHRAYEFTTPATVGTKGRPFFHLLMTGVTGTAWLDDVLLEELR